MMAESWYVPVAPEFIPEMGSHVFRAGVPDDVYDIPNAWDQEEVEFGLWILHIRDGVTLTADQRARMVKMGCKLVKDGKPEKATTIEDRTEKLKLTTIEAIK